MALVVETGSGLSTAEAYASQAEADAYFAKLGQTAAWNAVADKEVALRKGANYIERKYQARFRGVRQTTTQRLSFPRASCFDDNGFYITGVPECVKEANIELALISNTDTLLPAYSGGTISKESVKVGEIATSTDYVDGKDPVKHYPAIDGMLYRVLLSNGRVIRS